MCYIILVILYVCVVTPGPSRQPAHINSNEIIPSNTVNQVDDNSNLSLSTPAQNCCNVIIVQAQWCICQILLHLATVV